MERAQHNSTCQWDTSKSGTVSCLNTGIEITTLIKLNHWCVLDRLINTLTNSKPSSIVFVQFDSGGRKSVSRYLIKGMWDRELDSTTLMLSCCYNIQTHCVLFCHSHFASCHLLLQLMNTEYKWIIQELKYFRKPWLWGKQTLEEWKPQNIVFWGC